MSTELERPDAGVDAIIPVLIEIIRPYGKTKPESWTGATEIGTLGIDSFDFVEILFKLEDTYSIDIDYNANTTFSKMVTLGDLATEIHNRVAAKPAT